MTKETMPRAQAFGPTFGPAFNPVEAALYGYMAGTTMWMAAFSMNMAILRGLGYPVEPPANPRHATPV